jgi:IPT/TIG domain/Alpha galactosidase C-terminal beta sandwich domain
MARRLCKWIYEAAGSRPTHVSIAAMLLLFMGMTAITGCSGSGSAPAKLTVTSMTPSSVYTTGGLVAFAGTNFTPNTAVTFGGVAAQKVYFQSPTLITASTAPVTSTSTVDVVVSSPGGGSVTLSSALSYTTPPPPPPPAACSTLPCTYQAADPSNTLLGTATVAACAGCTNGVKVGSLGFGGWVIINNVYAPADGNYTLSISGCEGAGTQNYKVIVDGGAAVLQPLSGSNWFAMAPPVSLTVALKAGSANTVQIGNDTDWSPDVVSITVSGANSSTLPTISSISPSQLPITGGPVTVTGTNFTSGTTVAFGGVTAPAITSQTATQFTVMAPASTVVGPVDVTVNAGTTGTVTLNNGLTYTEPAACTSSTCTYQAWDPQNTLANGAAAAACVGCQYGEKVGSMGYGAGVTFNNVYAPSTGNYVITLVGCEGGGTQFYQVTPNGGTAATVPLYGSNWYVQTPPVSTIIPLKAGAGNTINVTNAQTWSPDIVAITISPANLPASTPTAQPVVMSSGQNQLTYDLASGLATFAYNGQTKIASFYGQAYSGATLFQSTSTSYTRTASNGANGETDITLTATDGSPTMVQRFILSDNHFLAQVELDGTALSSNEMSPIVVNQAGGVDSGSYTDPRFLVIPFDNNAYNNYNAETSNGITDTSSEVAAFYDNTSRNGLVFGSVTHDTWKTAVEATGDSGGKLDFLWTYAGANSPWDQLPHAAVKGNKITSPMIMVGYYDDWRTGMVDFANTNAQYAPMLTWSGPAPMGWNSWGKIQSNLSAANATAVADYFHTQLPSFNNQGAQYINLDDYWNNLSDTQLQAFVTLTHSQGQKAGIYWTPFIVWNWSTLTDPLDGAPSYTFNDVILKNPNGTPMGAVDSAYGVDPTHPGTKARIDYYINMFKSMGFDYIKLDFLSHGTLEGGSNNGVYYDTTIQTGIQAYNAGMKYIDQDIGGTMLIDESISPLFPYQYAHSRRVAGDTYGSISDTAREMASDSYGWWMAGRLYNWNNPDEMLLEGTEPDPTNSSNSIPFTANENKSRVTSGAVAGFMLNGDDVTDAGSPPLVQKWLTNSSIDALPSLGLNFQPVEGNTGTSPVNVLVAQQGGAYYIAVFNYDLSNPLSEAVDLGRAGLSSTSQYSVTDLWTGATSTATGTLTVSLGAAESTIVKLQ